MQAAIVENGVVVNVILVDELEEGMFDGEGLAIGDILDEVEGVFVRPTPPAPAPVVPEAVTMRQARLALLAAGKLDTVQATIAGLTGELGDRARIEWEFSSEVRRQQPLVIDLMPALELTEQQLDDLFILASTL